ncbi:MAG: fibronectin type III domain-containing protein [Candidatus Hydrogenedentota bacterium]|uniref:Xanthan lyase n=1 Tax=Sumerlaea chitinivorans TaxID=2250252 RepID=A0A2Z4Y2A7_SUMC1|nr:Xanthan lyase [Candidatus Sumerlaea chitinivorans]RMH30979.1 MAG: fibronectin type III domain-containing protein [Candidatus Hydrogenedentota bacterium]GIX45163.1 MAG: hypothetical protein KatS3mg130_1571 [Candidatus Sumerlaea sp.]
MSRLRLLLTLAVLVSGAAALAAPATMARDQILEIGYEMYLLQWPCKDCNIYSGVANATCPYTTTGTKQGIAYKWGGYDTRDSFWLNVVTNCGWAGDTNSAAIVSGTYGDDCSGFASLCLKSGRYTTSSFPSVTTLTSYALIAPGDLMNNAGSHVRIFEKYTATNLTMLLECTTGVSPGRVVRRVLPTDANYEPRRYNYVVPWPSIIGATATGSSSAVIDFRGAADIGFRVYMSTDLSTWTRVADESTLGPQAQQAPVTGLSPSVVYYFRVTALNAGGESTPSSILPLRLASGWPKVLLVNGYDRWTRKTESGGNAHSFLIRDAQCIAAKPLAFDSVDNLRVVDWSVDLRNYDCVWWLLGDESSTDDALSYQEQLQLQRYLEGGGKLFISGSELLYDLIAKANTINDVPFVTNYLKANYVSDGSAGNGYALEGVPGTPFEGITGTFDNGSGGMFNVLYPDVISPQAGATLILRYNATQGAGIMYVGPVGSSTLNASIVYLGFPFEAITASTTRAALANRVLELFFPALSSIEEWREY